MAILDQLQPITLWQYFEAITRIPRPSKKEGEIIRYLIDFAKEHHLFFKTDSAENLLVRKPASNGKSSSSTVVLQSHLDMVCEKNSDVEHNFDKDPIQPFIDGDWVKAKGTTLGADDGIGVAAMLALLADHSLEHGPLECLFTVDEETGLTGAFELSEGFFEGRMLINLDSEDEGELFIGCAGGIDTMATFQYTTIPVPDAHTAFSIRVTGLLGGHSGDDIHRNRGNALKIMVPVLLEAMNKFGAGISRFEGGNLKNAIAREAFATVLLPKAAKEEFKAFCNSFRTSQQKEIQEYEPSFSFQVEEMPASAPTMLPGEFALILIKALDQCPHGIIAWSKDIDGLVETSTNLASVKFIGENEILVTTSQRSSIESSKLQLAQEVATILSKAGAEIKHSNGYPGWAPNLSSMLLQISQQSYIELFKEQPQVKAIHAGLECGLFLEKYPGLDMISFGPTIKGAHSPDERLHIASVQKFWDLLVHILKKV